MKKLLIGIVVLGILYFLGIIFLGLPWIGPRYWGMQSIELISVTAQPTTVAGFDNPKPGINFNITIDMPSSILQKDVADGKNQLAFYISATDSGNNVMSFSLGNPQSFKKIEGNTYMVQGNWGTNNPDYANQDVAHWTATGTIYRIQTQLHSTYGKLLSPRQN